MPKRSRRHKSQPANSLASVGSKPLLLDCKSPPAVPTMEEVLSLADLEKHPVARDRYISTLPYFERDRWDMEDTPSCKCTYAAFLEGQVGCKGCKAGNAFARRQAKAIKTTAKRWVWFSNTRKVDDERGERLGTLGYLPPEIRQKIFRIIYECEENQEHFERLHTDPERKCHPNHECFHPWSDQWDINGLRLASPSTKAEVDYLYLSKTHFWFCCPLIFTRFLEQFSTIQHSQMRSVTFSLFGRCSHAHWSEDQYREYLDWIALFANLPPGLTSLKFEMYLQTQPGHWFRKGVKRDEVFHHWLGLSIALSKQARRRSPGLHLEWSSRAKHVWSYVLNKAVPRYPQWLAQDYSEMVDDVCKDPDKWSEEWLDGCKEVHEGCEMVVNWRRQRQDCSAMSLACKAEEVEPKR